LTISQLQLFLEESVLVGRVTLSLSRSSSSHEKILRRLSKDDLM
jgi:hypothetical protein